MGLIPNSLPWKAREQFERVHLDHVPTYQTKHFGIQQKGKDGVNIEQEKLQRDERTKFHQLSIVEEA